MGRARAGSTGRIAGNSKEEILAEERLRAGDIENEIRRSVMIEVDACGVRDALGDRSGYSAMK